MYKMYFNTGVKPENRLDKNGKVIMMKGDIIKGGVIQQIYFLEKEPGKNLILKCLVPSNYLPYIKSNEVAIKIVESEWILSDYAIFINTDV